MKKMFLIFMCCVLLVANFQFPAEGAGKSNLAIKNKYTQGLFSDIKGTESYAKSVQKAYEFGLMKEKRKGFFDPNSKMTIAEVIEMAAKVHELYNGGDGVIKNSGKAWYDGVVAYAIKNKIIKQGDFSNYNLNTTRGQLAYILANILPKSEFIELNYIEYLPDVYFGVPYNQEIFFLYGAGVLTGSDKYGTFNGNSYITRAEAATLIIRLVSPADRVTFAPSSYIFEGNVPIVDPYTKFRYFTNKDNGPAPELNFDEVIISGIKSPYDNGSNKPSEVITKSEGIKVILSMVLGRSDINNLAKKPVNTYKNAIWVEYAEERGLIEKGAITAFNETAPITTEETINFLISALRQFAPEVDLNSYSKIVFTEPSKYSNTTRQNAYFAYVWSLVDSNDEALLEQEMTKGKMDDLLIRAINKLNLKMGKKGQIKTTNLPKNAQAYPYILSSIENSVYEMPFSGWDSGEVGPRLCYKGAKSMYGRIDQMIREAYTEIVNIDYRTISKDHFTNAKKWSLDYSCGWVDELDNQIEHYVDYVKKNKIEITGKVTPLLPIVYFDGNRYRVRTKIEYTIQSSDTDIDLLLCDRIAYSGALKLCYSPTVYVSKSKTIYVDIALAAGLNVENSEIKGLIYYLNRYHPLSKQIAGKFEVKSVKL